MQRLFVNRTITEKRTLGFGINFYDKHINFIYLYVDRW